MVQTPLGTLIALFAFAALHAPLQADTADDLALLKAMKVDNSHAFTEALANGANANFIDPNGEPLINRAAREGKQAFVSLLLKNGASTGSDKAGYARHLAMRHGHQQIVLMLARHDKIPVPNPDAAMLASAINDGDTGGVEEALQIGISANSKDFTGRPVLTMAARLGYTDIIRLLLQHGANIDAVDEIGFTAFMEAARVRADKVIQVLWRAGANTRLRANDGTTIYALYPEFDEALALP